MSTEKRSTGRIIAIVVGVLVILCLCLACVAGVVYWRFGDQLLGLLGLAPQTQAAKLMPADTPIYAGVSLNLQNQAGYQNLKNIYLDNPDVQEALDALMADFEDETSLVFEEDIQPWLGTEAALALPSFTGLDDVRGSGGSPEVLLAVSTRDVEASEAFLDKVRQSQTESSGRPFTRDEHQGVTYWFQEAESQFEPDTYMAVFNDFVVFSTSEETLFGAIDRVKSRSESLADNESFQTTMKALPNNGAFFTFVNWTAIAEVILQDSPVSLEPDQLSQLAAVRSVGMAITLQAAGLQIDTAIQFDPEKLSESARAALNRPGSSNEILERIPADAIAFYNGYDLRSMWQQAREGLAANPDFERQLADLEAEAGLSLDEDIFGWMTGEFAVVVTEAQPADESAPPLGGYLLIGADDVTLAQNKVAKLTDLLEQEMFIEFEGRTIGGAEMQVIADPFSEAIVGGYGFWDNYLVAGYLEDALEAALAAQGDPVANSPYFEAISGRLPSKNYGYFFVDIDAVQHLAEDEMSEFEHQDYEENVRPFIEPLRAIGIAADVGSGRDGTQTVRMFLLVTEE